MNNLQGFKVIVYPVKDVGQAKLFFDALLGVEPYVDSPYYVGYKIGDHEIGLDPNGHKQGLTELSPCFDVSDIKSTIKSLIDAGAQIYQDVRDVGAGPLVASVKDKDGNITGLRQFP